MHFKANHIFIEGNCGLVKMVNNIDLSTNIASLGWIFCLTLFGMLSTIIGYAYPYKGFNFVYIYP
jgi:hypothetical protein